MEEPDIQGYFQIINRRSWPYVVRGKIRIELCCQSPKIIFGHDYENIAFV